MNNFLDKLQFFKSKYFESKKKCLYLRFSFNIRRVSVGFSFESVPFVTDDYESTTYYISLSLLFLKFNCNLQIKKRWHIV